jgi:GNAT superfamily N-acetyltransferase
LNPNSISVRYAESVEDCQKIFQFLYLVTGPSLFCPIDPRKAFEVILGVKDQGVAVMAMYENEHLVGSLGLTPGTWWYGHGGFLTDQWFFIYPQFKHLGIGAQLLAEGAIIAQRSGVDLWINGHMRRRSGHQVIFSRPIVILPKEEYEARKARGN